MKKLILTILSHVVATATFACEVCKRNQPKVLQEFTHGAGPGGSVDYIIMITAIAIVAVTLFLSIKYLVRPKEDNVDHIKNIVTDEGF